MTDAETADLARDLEVHLGRHRCAAAGHESQGRQHRNPRLLALQFDERQIKGRRTADDGDVVRAEHLRRGRGVERLDEHECHAHAQAGDQVVEPPDVRERERDAESIAVPHVLTDREPLRRGDGAAVGVLCALRIGGGTRCVVDPPDLVRRRRRRCGRQHRRIGVG